MATYNFYFRTIPINTTSAYWKIDYPDTTTPTHAVCRNVFDNIPEIFVLYPRIFYTNSADTTDVVPTLFNKSLYEFRVASGVYSTTIPYEKNFASIDSLIADSLAIRLKLIHLTSRTSTDTEPAVDCRNLGWGDVGWNWSNASSFRSQIATFIAESCDVSRTKPDNLVEPIASYSDFSVYIFSSVVSVSSSSYTFVVFYPGNDPAYQQLVTVNT